MTPAEYFGLPVIGRATTPPIAGFPAGNYEVIKIVELLLSAGRSFMTNKWLYESARVPLCVTEQLGATFEPFEEEPTKPTMLIRRR